MSYVTKESFVLNLKLLGSWCAFYSTLISNYHIQVDDDAFKQPWNNFALGCAKIFVSISILECDNFGILRLVD